MQCPTHLLQSNILQLPDPLAGHTEFTPDFLERLRATEIKAKPATDNLLLSAIQYIEQLAQSVDHLIEAQTLIRSLSRSIGNKIAIAGAIRIIPDRRIQRNRPPADWSHPSSLPFKSDDHLFTVNNDRYFAGTIRILQHSVKMIRLLDNGEIIK